MPNYNALSKLAEVYRELENFQRKENFINSVKNGTVNSFLVEEAKKEYYSEKREGLWQLTVVPIFLSAFSVVGLGLSPFPKVALLMLVTSVLWLYRIQKIRYNIEKFYKVPEQKLNEQKEIIKLQLKNDLLKGIKNIHDSVESDIPKKTKECIEYLNSTEELVTSYQKSMQDHNQALSILDWIESKRSSFD